MAPSLEVLVDEAQHLLSEVQVGSMSPSQLVALAFCGAGLSFDPKGRFDAHAGAALVAAARGQDVSGCWALGRVIREDRDSGLTPIEVEISTYEISWALADATLRLNDPERPRRYSLDGESMLETLLRAATYAQRSQVELLNAVEPPSSGWCCDHPYKKPIIESWTSATVLQFALSLEAFLRAQTSATAARSYSVARPSDPSWPGWLRWPSLLASGEMDSSARVLEYLDRELVQRILGSPRTRPSPEDRTVSALLFGPPGTMKTTIVRGIADGLKWPLVTLSPGVFIDRGLELIEARAAQVFQDLLVIERAVVMFDECDELFRERTASASDQTRNIMAFVTASMLPKLQRLHDEGAVLFFICTNSFRSLDPAVKRLGRVDHIIGVGPPDAVARRTILKNELSSLEGGPGIRRVDVPPWIATVCDASERFTRLEMVVLAKQLSVRWREAGMTPEAMETIGLSLVRSHEPSLNISKAVYDEFLTDQARYSDPHRLVEEG
jgi:hypothetical protein